MKAFKLSYSSDGKSWKTYQENNGKELVSGSNTGRVAADR